MIKPYKKISIIYGGSGRNIAKLIEKKLNERHIADMYPIVPMIVADEVMDGTSITTRIYSLISGSTYSLIIFTYDDVDGTRVRENVLIETGMILMSLKNINDIFCLVEKSDKGKLPSDLHDMNMNVFDKNNPETVAEQVCRSLCERIGNGSNKDILHSNNYIYDYTKVLDEVPSYVYDKIPDEQLEGILDCWKRNLCSFSFFSEKVMYLLERITFITVFKRDEKLIKFIETAEKEIVPTEQDMQNDNISYVNSLYKFVTALLEYHKFKSNDKVVSAVQESPENSADAMLVLSYSQDIIDFVNKTKNEPQKYEYNWLIRLLAYDYAGVTLLKAVYLGTRNDNTMHHIDTMIEYLQNAVEIAQDYNAVSTNMWNGYLYYNLARAYIDRYMINNDHSDYEHMQCYLTKAIFHRQQWCTRKVFKGVFSNALSYEYFLAKHFELSTKIVYSNVSDDKKQKEIFINEISTLETELRDYCINTIFGRFSDMQSNLKKLRMSLN